MTSEPKAPGAAAIYLYTQLDRDDQVGREVVYKQVKVLTEEGRDQANVSISYDRQMQSIHDIEARVVQPDGSIIPFKGTVYDRPLAASRDLGIYTKTFTMEDVRVGSVIEYRYRRRIERVGVLYHSNWPLSQDLFVRHASFSLRVSNEMNMRMSLPVGLPEGTVPPKLEKNMVRMQLRDVPAFISEDHMPPLSEVQLAVRFIYTNEASSRVDAAQFWANWGSVTNTSIERFIGDPKALRERIDGLFAAGDSTEQKVRKIYEHVQQLHNVGEPPLAGAPVEQRKCNTSPLSASARDVARSGCGNTRQLQLYFIALVRAAGIPAVPAMVAPRTQAFFQPQSMQSSALVGLMAVVTIDGREVVLQPGLSILPFGQLPWAETAAPAFKLDGQRGQWITTTMPRSRDALTHRHAKLTLTEDGLLQGTVTVRHTGHEAIGRLVVMREADEQTRNEMLIEDLRRIIAVPAEISVARPPDWGARNAVVETQYQVKVQQWAVPSGNRMLVGIGLFGKEQAGKFVAPERVHPIYFQYPFSTEDQVEITLPAGATVQNVPAPRVPADAALGYQTSVTTRDGVLTIRRALTQEALLANQSQYPRFRSFYELVRTGDQEQIVLVH